MSFPIPLTTLTAGYQQFAAPGGLYENGYFTLANGNVDMIVHYGTATGIASTVFSPNVTPGQYVFGPTTPNLITYLEARAANGTVSATPQTIQGQLFEPRTPSIIPVASSSLTNNISTSMQQIGQQVLGSLSGSVSFTAIPQTYTNLRLVVVAFSDQASDQSLAMQFNGDTGTHYNFQYNYGNNVTPTASQVLSNGSAVIGVIPTHTEGTWGMAEVVIPNYNMAIFHPASSTWTNYGAGGFLSGTLGVMWTGGAAISSLAVFPGAGNFGVGSTFTLYGF